MIAQDKILIVDDYPLVQALPISKHNRMVESLRQSEERYRTIIDEIDDGYYEVDLAGSFTFVNDSMSRILGYSRKELIGMNYQLFTHEKEVKSTYETFNKVYRTGETLKWFPFTNIKKDGTLIFVEDSISTLRNKEGKIIGFRGISRDITERKRAEEELRTTKETAQKYLDIAGAIMVALDAQGKVTMINQKGCAILGFSKEEILGQNWFDTVIPWTSRKEIKMVFDKLMAAEIKPVEYFENSIQTKSGQEKIISWHNTLVTNSLGQIIGTLSSGEDITERKQAEEALSASEKKYREMVNFLPLSIFEIDIKGYIVSFNSTSLEVFGYKKEDYDESMKALQFFEPNEWERLGKNMQKVIKGISVPGQEYIFLRKDGSTFPGLIYASLVINENGPVGIRGTIIDITERKRAEDDLKHSFERLRKALGATVNAISSMVETRDPYTAGHQRRVADLARAIATEMGLPNDQIDGIRMAAIIHDIGKISVPAEILSMPKKLTDIEFSLIKTHPQSGHDILRDIDFTSPVAQIVLQHHERMDGSGYPNELTGSEILLEARILAVADVVEAIASHRPYRPAHGIDVALEEISINKGTLYDPEVVNTCLKLFKEKGFKLE